MGRKRKKVEAGVEAGLMLLVCTQHAVICEYNQTNRCIVLVMLSERMHTSTQRPSIAPTHESEHLRKILLALGSLHFKPERFDLFGTCTNCILSLPEAELYPLEDGMLIALDAGLTSGRTTWEQSQESKG